MEKLLSPIMVGLAHGCIYSLIAIGFVIIYKSSGILNFAQGAIVILCAYVFYSLSTYFGLSVIVSIILMPIGIGFVLLIAYIIYYNVKKPYKCQVCGGGVYSEKREEVPVSYAAPVQNVVPVQNVGRNYCFNCGSAIDTHGKYCPNCGVEL